MGRNRIGPKSFPKQMRLLDNSVFRQYVVYSTDLAELARAAAPDPRIRWATEADKAALTFFGLDCRLVHRAFESGGRVAVLEDAGQIVAANWYWINPVSVDVVLTIRYSADAVMASNSVVNPAHRGLRYFAALKAFAAREFLALGYRRMLSYRRWRNVSAKRAHRHAGARPWFRIVILRGPFRLRAIKERNTFSIGRWSTTNRKVIVIP